MPRKRSSTIESAGVRVRVFKRGGRYWLDVRAGTARKRVSADTTDRSLAESKAAHLAREIAKQQLLGVTPKTLTIGETFAAYQDAKGCNLKPNWRRAAETRASMFLAAWGESFRVAQVSQTSVDAYCAARRGGRVAPPLRAARIRDGQTPPALRAGALDSDFRWLSSVFNWAREHKLPSGEYLLDRNPLHGCKKALPREKNVRRPIASDERYVRTLAHANEVDPLGRLRLILTLAYETGRRESAIIKLRASDVLLSRERIAEALANAGMDEGRAAKMPHGALRWSAENDKQGVASIEVISAEAREELQRYLEQNPRLGDVPLFPGPMDATLPLSRVVAYRWLMRAEAMAEVAKLRGGGFHPYRRLYASARRHIPDKDVMRTAGWKSSKTLAIYQQSDDDGALAAVTNGRRLALASG